MPTYVNKHGHEITGTLFVVDGNELLVSLEPRSPWGRSYRAKARVYGATENLVPEVNAAEPPYVAHTDENSSPEEIAAEKAWLSWRRRAVTAATKRLNRLIADGALAPIVGFDVRKAKFSYTAGCSCKCSPGYVTDSYVIDPITGRFADVHISSLKGLTRKAA